MSEQNTQEQLANDSDPYPSVWKMVERETEHLKGWDVDPDKTGLEAACDVIRLLMALTAERDERIKKLHLKLGQLVERGP